MSKKKFSGNISGKGYYIALIACAVAIGITGYLYYRNTNQPAEAADEQSAIVEPAPQEDVEAVATRPAPSEPTAPAAEAVQPSVPTALEVVDPVAGEMVTLYAVDCLCYNQTTRDWRTHNGVDIAAQAGTPVLAAADGEVYSVYEDQTMGMTVVIVHDGGYTTGYASLAETVTVAPGDPVHAGQTIGYVGNTALLESALGDHLHFSVTCRGENMDPMEFLG